MIRLDSLREFWKQIQYWWWHRTLPRLVLVRIGWFCSPQYTVDLLCVYFAYRLFWFWNDTNMSSSTSTTTTTTASTTTFSSYNNTNNNNAYYTTVTATTAATTTATAITSRRRTRFQSSPQLLTLTSVAEISMDCWSCICLFLHPYEITQLATVNRILNYRYAIDNEYVWKPLWYRDYGNVLLQWDLGRDALSRSLDGIIQQQEEKEKSAPGAREEEEEEEGKHRPRHQDNSTASSRSNKCCSWEEEDNDNEDRSSLEIRLSQRLDELIRVAQEEAAAETKKNSSSRNNDDNKLEEEEE